MDAELLVDVLEVLPDGAQLDHERRCDVVVRQPVGDAAHHLALAGG
jgi:hypothetical protein